MVEHFGGPFYCTGGTSGGGGPPAESFLGLAPGCPLRLPGRSMKSKIAMTNHAITIMNIPQFSSGGVMFMLGISPKHSLSVQDCCEARKIDRRRRIAHWWLHTHSQGSISPITLFVLLDCWRCYLRINYGSINFPVELQTNRSHWV